VSRPGWLSRRRRSRGEAEPASTPVLFIHVMKTGGTSVMRSLRETFALDEIYPYRALDIRYDEERLDIQHHLSVPYLLALPEERRERIRVYTGHYPYVVRELLGIELQAITILRDPMERTLSLLRQFRRKSPWMGEPGLGSPLVASTLEEVYDEPMVFGPLIHNHQTKIFSMTPADEPQTYMDMLDVDRARLERAKVNLAEVEVVGLIERYDDFLDEVGERYGWTIVRGARKNVTPESELLPVDPALRRRITEDNAFDVELYEYAKELVELRLGRRTVGA